MQSYANDIIMAIALRYGPHPKDNIAILYVVTSMVVSLPHI